MKADVTLPRGVPARDVVVGLGSLAAVAVVTAALRALPGVSPTTVALAFFLVVLGAATMARLRVAVLVSVLATLTLNFFFLPPIGTFAIADAQHSIALLAFLVVAVVASNLSAAAQGRAREAIARRNEVARLFELTRDVLLSADSANAAETLARHVARRFGLSRVAICLPADRGWQIHQGGVDPFAIDIGALDTALANAGGPTRDLRAGQPHGLWLVPLRHGTHVVGLLAVGSPALDAGALDAVAGVVAIALERAQFRAERDAAALIRQKVDLAQTLLASLSHDLRTPLTVVRVAVDNLRRDLLPDDRDVQAGAALAELDRLTRLVHDLLEMARIDAAAIRTDRQWVAAADVIDAAVAHVGPALRDHHVRVEADTDVAVEIDPRLASVALSQLLENAALYSPAHGEILVQARVKPDGLHVAVTDHGPGLDPGELDRIFERFYRGRASREASSGTGMGLSIARGLVSAVGGRVWAENVQDAGARFTLVVPGATRAVTVAR